MCIESNDVCDDVTGDDVDLDQAGVDVDFNSKSTSRQVAAAKRDLTADRLYELFILLLTCH